MVSAKAWNIINVSIILIIVLLILNLFGVNLPSLGQAIYYLDPADPLCLVNTPDSLSEWNDLNRCCLEARRHVECLPELHQLQFGITQWVCQSGPAGISEIWFNNKAYKYCQQQPIW